MLTLPCGRVPDLNSRHDIPAAELPIKREAAGPIAIYHLPAPSILVDDDAPIIQQAALISRFELRQGYNRALQLAATVREGIEPHHVNRMGRKEKQNCTPAGSY